MHYRRSVVCTFAAFIVTISWMAPSSVAEETDQAPPELAAATLGNTPNVHRFGDTWLCGQPSAAEFRMAKENGIEVVITLRQDGEIDWNEEALVEQLGLKFHQVSFRTPASLTDAILDETLELMRQADETPTMLHCGSANRVGAIWLAHRVLHDGLDIATALDEAHEVGLRSQGYEARVVSYVRRKLASRDGNP